MPPSINSSYAHVGKRRFASSSLKSFKTSCMTWAIINRPHLVKVRDELELRRGYSKVCLEFVFRFPEKRLYTKQGEVPKKLDVSNRIKAAEDFITEFLGFDDRHVFKVTAEKIIGAVENFDVKIYIY